MPLLQAMIGWPRRVKQLIVVAVDLAAGLLAMWLAFSLRLDTLHWPQNREWLIYLIGPLLAIPVFWRFGLYRAIFRHTGMAALSTTATAVAVYSVLLSLLLFTTRWPVVPRSVGVLQPLIFLLLVLASRTFARAWLSGRMGTRVRSPRSRLLIYGAGTAGVQTARGLDESRQYSLHGFIDDDPAMAGRSIDGVPVFGPADVAGIVRQQRISDILLALPGASRERRHQIIERLRPLPVHVQTLPALGDLASGRVTVRDFRELDVEDLLGRAPVPPNPRLLARDLAGKVVLVTGAGGSIGSELCRQIVRERPNRLLLLDLNEFALYTVHQELLRLCDGAPDGVQLVPLLGNVCEPARLSRIVRSHRPHTVYHAAAYKHVPLVEQNPAEGVLNNVFGTLYLVRAALEAGVERLVLISTDKAVRPSSVMGASKRVAEQILQALSACDRPVFGEPERRGGPEPEIDIENRTCLAMVRFGNVLGSSGSVVPLFRQQIAAGGPITVTDTRVTRYFMTIPEAAQLVLQAGAMARGGDVFVLDMGEPIRIIDLAQRMIELSGLRRRDAEHPGGDIDIVTTGLRPGEKLYEELLIGESPAPTEHPRIMTAQEPFLCWSLLARSLERLRSACVANDIGGIIGELQRIVPGARFAANGATAIDAAAAHHFEASETGPATPTSSGTTA